MKNKLLNSSLILGVVLLLAVFAFYVRVGVTADSVVVMRASGMTCSSCIKKVTAALEAQRGVAAAEVDLAGGFVIAGYDSKQVGPQRLAQAVSATGFKAEVAELLTPQQFRAIVGRDPGAKPEGGCCGPRGCGNQ